MVNIKYYLKQMFYKIFFISLISFIFSAAISCSHGNISGNYGEITSYKKDQPVLFPDFTLTYTGERKETSTFPNGKKFTFTFYDFKIKSNDEEKTISWTSGTGVIEPLDFEFAGKKFTLELRYRENEKKKLDEDELVITSK